jgi:chromosome segregation ATPase
MSPVELKGMKKPELLAYAVNLGEEHSQLQNEVADRLTRIEQELRSSNAENSRLTDEVANLSTEVATLNTRLSVNERSLVAAERSANSNAQYARNRQLELWNLPSKITDAKDLKVEAAKIVSLTGVDDIDVAHKIKKQGSIIMEFRSRTKRNQVVMARKELKNRKEHLALVECSKLSIVESMSWETKRLDFLCRKLKATGVAKDTYFFMGKLNLVDANNNKQLISHIDDLFKKYEKKDIMKLLVPVTE